MDHAERTIPPPSPSGESTHWRQQHRASTRDPVKKCRALPAQLPTVAAGSLFEKRLRKPPNRLTQRTSLSDHFRSSHCHTTLTRFCSHRVNLGQSQCVIAFSGPSFPLHEIDLYVRIDLPPAGSCNLHSLRLGARRHSSRVWRERNSIHYPARLRTRLTTIMMTARTKSK
jgi:hypothetical protein